MFSRRIAPALLGAAVILHVAVASASATTISRPAPGAERVPSGGERPLTAAEQAASDRKVAAAIAYLASPAARAAERTSLACATPDALPISGSAGADDAIDTFDTPVTLDCDLPRGFLAVSARDQIRGYYCGPAVGQVIANYTWAVGPCERIGSSPGAPAAYSRGRRDIRPFGSAGEPSKMSLQLKNRRGGFS